jgi:flavoprotein
MNMRIAWGITGSGDQLTECVTFMKELTKKYNLEVHVYLSREGAVVLKFYNRFRFDRSCYGEYGGKDSTLHR